MPRHAARLDGVWWGVTAYDAQLVADAMGCQLLTPLMADAIRSAAKVNLMFIADQSSGTPSMKEAAAMLRFSARLASRLADASADVNLLANQCPVTCLGVKDWVLTRGLQEGINPWTGKVLPKNWACNYGAYSTGRLNSASGSYHVLQRPGYRHSYAHADYSQLLRVCRPKTAVPSTYKCTLTRLPGVPQKQSRPELGPALALLGLG